MAENPSEVVAQSWPGFAPQDGHEISTGKIGSNADSGSLNTGTVQHGTNSWLYIRRAAYPCPLAHIAMYGGTVLWDGLYFIILLIC